ncbi:unnamed protein product [Mytilus coruscus]|uniref:Uncharacterized protein n=1 Tax=Mytilus coruscus TaxID=42192 RepID=A0A6J8CE98_MYTCO|nr:unnamed protein product [Mytilus coruscus]
MLSGQAVSCSVRGFMLVDIALHCLITEELFEINQTNEEADHTELPQSNSILMEAGQLLATLLNKQIPVETVVNHDTLKAIEKELESAGYKSGDQHVESTRTRKEKDHNDIVTLREFLKERSPFTEDKSLRNIETGMVANEEANSDNAKEIGR